jgi:hypothetical protein
MTLAAANYGYDPTAREKGVLKRPSVPLALPIRYIVPRQFLPPVGAQGTAANPGSPPTCAAWATVYGLATYTAAAAPGVPPTDPSLCASPANIYCQVVGASGVCEGTLIGDYLDILTTGLQSPAMLHGTPNLATAPYPAEPNCNLLWSSYDPNAAIDTRFAIPGWAMVETADLPGIKAIIAGNGALSYGTALFENFETYDGEPSPVVGPIPAVVGSGHCMLIIGYDDSLNAFLLQNSFGPDWGCKPEGFDTAGYIWMDYGLLQSLSQGVACYVTQG